MYALLHHLFHISALWNYLKWPECAPHPAWSVDPLLHFRMHFHFIPHRSFLWLPPLLFHATSMYSLTLILSLSVLKLFPPLKCSVPAHSHANTHAHTHAHLHALTNTCTHSHTYTCTHTQMHNVYTHAYMQTHTFIDTCTHSCTLMYTHIYTCTCILTCV